MAAHPTHTPHVFLIAGEHSGDHLGAGLMAALRALRPHGIRFSGVGGSMMAAEGLASLFPMEDVAVMGPGAILRQLPRIVRRVYQTVDSVVAAAPDVLVIIDAPEFTHPIAKRVRRRAPNIPVVDYVSPSVWAWRSGRAPRMRAYVDHVMALLPFEPAVHERLRGPPCTYVGHPLIDRMPPIAKLDVESLARRLRLEPDRPILLVLPGSRRSEVARLMRPFGETVAALMQQGLRPQVIVPTLPALRELVQANMEGWPSVPHIVVGENDKWCAFKLARAALAASGTVTLELAMAGAPMVVSYRVDRIALMFRHLVNPPHFALSNLVLEERAFPELMQEQCEPAQLAAALRALLNDTPERARQLSALERLRAKIMRTPASPSRVAAEIVLQYAGADASRSVAGSGKT